MESESKRLGETHTTARFSLQLEVDCLEWDLERLEDELARARKDIDEKEGKSRDREANVDKLHAENRELASQLAAQTQARLNVSEKLDGVQGPLNRSWLRSERGWVSLSRGCRRIRGRCCLLSRSTEIS